MNERQIFLAAVEIENIDEQTKRVQELCGDDANLRLRVEELLRSHNADDSFLESPAIERVEETLISGEESTNDKSFDESGKQEFLQYLELTERDGFIGRLAHYDVECILGRGAFGIVAKGFDTKLHRVVAIKLLAPELATTSPPRKRFLREARTAAAVSHENIVAIHAVEEQPTPYLVMEFVPGGTLADRLNEQGPLETHDILHIGQQIAAGLAAAHAAGLIHRDIKPSNILLDDGPAGRAKISDFGLARAVDDASMTASGAIAGTPMYMSPEQACGKTLDHRTDLFSLGSVLYQTTCGRPPFRAPSTLAVIKRVCEDTPRALDDVIPGTPWWLSTIIFNLLDKDRDARFQSAEEVAELMTRCRTELQLNGHVTCVERTAELAETQATQNIPVRAQAPRDAMKRWILGGLAVVLFAAAAFSPILNQDDSVRDDIAQIVPENLPASSDESANSASPKIVVESMPRTDPAAEITSPDAMPRKVDVQHAAALAVLEVGGSVFGYSDKGRENVNSIAELPSGPFAIEGINLDNVTQPLDAVMRRVGRLPVLQNISAVNSSLDDSQLAYLANLDLSRATLANAFVGEESADTIASWKRLNGIDLSGTGAGDAVCVALSGIPTLRTVQFNGSRVEDAITDEGLRHLAKCSLLKDASLVGQKAITYEGIVEFSKLPNLRRLNITASGLSDAAIETLASIKQLRILEVSTMGTHHSPLSSDGVARLRKSAPHLWITHPDIAMPGQVVALNRWALMQNPGVTRELRGGPITESNADTSVMDLLSLPNNHSLNGADVVHLASARCLSTLDWPNLTQSDSACETLGALPALYSRLNVMNSDITGTGLAKLGPLTALLNLYLHRCKNIDDEALSKLPPLPGLLLLRLDECSIDGSGLKFLTQTPNLQKLQLSGTSVGSQTLRYLEPLADLRYLQLNDTPIDDAAVPFLSQLHGLRLLDAWHTDLTPAAIEKLHAAIPLCTIRWDDGLVVPEEEPDDTTAAPIAETDPHRAAAVAVIRAGGTLEGVKPGGGGRFSASKITDLPEGVFVVDRVWVEDCDGPLGDVCERLGQLATLRDFFAHHTSINDIDLVHLRDADLALVGLSDTSVTDASAETIGNWKRLTSIDLGATHAGDTICQALAGLPLLDTVKINDWDATGGVTDTGLASLSKCPQLTWLAVSRCRSITAEGIRSFQNLKHLRYLNVTGTLLDDSAVDALASLQQLRVLHLQPPKTPRIPISDPSVRELQRRMANTWIDHPLTRIHPDEQEIARYALSLQPDVMDAIGRYDAISADPTTQMPIAELQFLNHRTDGAMAAGLQGARTLNALKWRRLTNADAALAAISDNTGLCLQLDIRGADVTGKGLESLGPLTALDQLYLAECLNIDDTALAKLPILPCLDLLNLHKCPLQGPGLRHLTKTPNVTRLDLSRTGIDSASTRHLAELRYLRVLSLGGTKIDDAAVPHLAKLKQLQLLEVWSTKLTDGGLAELHAALPGCAIRFNNKLIVPSGSERPSVNAAVVETSTDPHRAAALAVVAAGGSVSGYFNGRRFSASTTDELPDGPMAITAIYLANLPGPFGDAFSQLGKLPWLTRVDAAGSPVTDADLALLSGLDLESAGLAGTEITDLSAGTISTWQRLRGIDVGATRVGDGVCRALAMIPTLDTARLNSYLIMPQTISDAGMNALAESRSLRWLSLHGCTNITASGVARLNNISNLRRLELADCGVEAYDTYTDALSSMKHLHELRLWAHNYGEDSKVISDEAARSLEKTLPNCWINHPATRSAPEEHELVDWILQQKPRRARDAAGATLTGDPKVPVPVELVRFAQESPNGSEAVRFVIARNLTTLEWPNLKNADFALETLARDTGIWWRLKIAGADVTGTGLQSLAARPELVNLSMPECAEIDDDALSHLPHFPGLWTLDLGRCSIRGPGLTHLVRTPNVQRLNLGDNTITSDSLRHLAVLKRLRTLNLASNSIDDDGIPHLKELKGLQELEIWGNPLSDEAISELHEALPRCLIRWTGDLVVPE